MSIQSVNNNNYQNQNSEKSDFQTFTADAKARQSALSSGDQDQVTLSESALSMSAAVGNVLKNLLAMNSRELGIIHRLQPSTVKVLLHQTEP
jgi:hypothetical protein